MFVNRKRIVVEFSDCDPANIVFFANYFRWFDDCTSALFAAAGVPPWQAFKQHGVLGMPIVDARARFNLPSSYGDELEVESSVTEWRRSSFVVTHKFFRDGELAVEGHETRVWAAAHPTRSGRMKAVPIPKELAQKLSKNNTRTGRKSKTTTKGS